jgi:hypothetical protein
VKRRNRAHRLSWRGDDTYSVAKYYNRHGHERIVKIIRHPDGQYKVQVLKWCGSLDASIMLPTLLKAKVWAKQYQKDDIAKRL